MPSRNFFTLIVSLFCCYACYSVAVKNRDASTLSEAIDIVEREALYERTRPELFKAAMKGMLSDLDVHSTYLSGDVFRSFDEEIDGQFGGVGVYFENVPTDGMYVLAVMPGHPADKSGLEAGDLIVSVDGKSTLNQDRGEIAKLMRGKVGERLEVEYKRNGEVETASIVRAIIPLTSVHGYTRQLDGSWDFTLPDHPNIAYIRIKQFADPTTGEMEVALNSLGNEFDSIIFDLRNNPGGLLTCATDICDMLLEKDKTIVSTRGRRKKLISEIKSVSDPTISPSVNIVVLVNRNSASASEIMAGCLQDHHRATVIGEQSYGKGTVQKVIQMKQGSAALKLTTASYWRPSDKNIDRHEKKAKLTGIWGVRPVSANLVPLSETEILGQLKQMQNREIRGLIPLEQRSHLLQLTEKRFKQSLQESLEDAESKRKGKGKFDTDVEEDPESPKATEVDDEGSDDANSDNANSDNESSGNESSGNEIDRQSIESIDLERDETLERAIEFLVRPANQKIAA